MVSVAIGAMAIGQDYSRLHAPASDCFDGSSLGGPWIAGAPYSASLRL